VVLITGANGQLGTEFKKLFDKMGVLYISTSHKDLDITKPKEIKAFLNGKYVDIIINCAAYNAVDKAEDEVEECTLLNRDAPKHLAEAAKEIDAVYATYSTDFVFDGEKNVPYTEEDLPNPLSVYSRTKYEGEQKVLSLYGKVFIIRTSWMFGSGGNNFIKTVINWSKTRKRLSIVDDQISAPTYSKDLAEFTWELIQSREYGLYHLSNGGECSKYDQVHYVLQKIGWQGELIRVKTEDFNLPAKRAKYSKLSSGKAEKIIGKKLPDWKDAIDRFLEEMKCMGEL